MLNDILALEYLKIKQKYLLKNALKEMNQGKKITHWAWWAFPIFTPGMSEPFPKTYLTNETIKDFLKTYPKEWKELMIKIEINLKKSKNIKSIFPKIDLPRIRKFLEIMKKQKNKKKWLSKLIKQMEYSFL